MITDARSNKRGRKTSLTIFTSHFICKVRKGCVGFYCERELETEQKLPYFDPNLWQSTLCLSFFAICSSGGPEATLLGDGFLYSILSASSPDLNSSGPKGPFGLMWLSLPHLLYNSVRSSTLRPSYSTGTGTQLSYIIVRRSLDHWNRMFNRHQAEITVMQFRGHSLPVHHSLVAQWDLYFVPYYLPSSVYAISFDYWPLECVTSFRCITLE